MYTYLPLLSLYKIASLIGSPKLLHNNTVADVPLMATLSRFIVIAQLREKRDKLGAKAIRIDSTADKPCLFPVFIIERT